jgi:hypothetical protein
LGGAVWVLRVVEGMTELKRVGKYSIVSEKIDNYKSAWLILPVGLLFGLACVAFMLAMVPGIFQTLCIFLCGVLGGGSVLITTSPGECGIRIKVIEYDDGTQTSRYYPYTSFPISDNPEKDILKINKIVSKYEQTINSFIRDDERERQEKDTCCDTCKELIRRVKQE